MHDDIPWGEKSDIVQAYYILTCTPTLPPLYTHMHTDPPPTIYSHAHRPSPHYRLTCTPTLPPLYTHMHTDPSPTIYSHAHRPSPYYILTFLYGRWYTVIMYGIGGSCTAILLHHLHKVTRKKSLPPVYLPFPPSLLLLIHYLYHL